MQAFTDKAAIGLSSLCAIHCLIFPLVLIVFPSFASLPLNNEAFHLWMVLAVIPMCIFALGQGCKHHKQSHLLGLGLIGLACLVSAVVLGEHLLGEALEKFLTAVGSAILVFGHYKNYRLCKSHDSCACTSQADVGLPG